MKEKEKRKREKKEMKAMQKIINEYDKLFNQTHSSILFKNK